MPDVFPTFAESSSQKFDPVLHPVWPPAEVAAQDVMED